jgi:UDP-glucose 4-epimerase
MDQFNCKKLIFSSSATVYGNAPLPLVEASPVGQGITNPYGQTKFMIEVILKDFFISKKDSIDASNPWELCVLRYFNPVGAHPSGMIGEDPAGRPNNLMPVVCQAAVGKLKNVQVFGNDYPTKDGTGVRDYIHVVDLASGHVAALKYLEKHASNPQGLYEVFNLGSGNGYSVLEVIQGMKKASNVDIPYVLCPRRAGDLAVVYSDPSKALAELGWKTVRGLTEMCEDAWRWQSNNPKGYPNE